MTTDGEHAERFIRDTAPAVLGAIDQHAAHRVIYHADVDGLCAAACLVHLVGLRATVPSEHAWIPTSEFHFANWADDYPPVEGVLTLTADINFSSRPAFLKKLDALYGSSLVVIDDHVINEEPPKRLKLINPNLGIRAEGAIDLASSLYAFRLATEAGCRIPDWVPVLGLYFDRQLAAYASLFTEIAPRRSLDQVIRTLSSVYLDDTSDHFTDRSLELMTKAIAASDRWSTFCATVEEDPDLTATETENQLEIEAQFRVALKELQHLGHWRGEPVQFHEFSSRLQIANIIASRLRGQNGKGIFVAVRRGEYFAQIELRLGAEVKGVDLVSLLRDLSVRASFTNFGGHPRAAGGAVALKNLPDLLEQLREVSGG